MSIPELIILHFLSEDFTSEWIPNFRSIKWSIWSEELKKMICLKCLVFFYLDGELI